jgi:hypothetical protein
MKTFRKDLARGIEVEELVLQRIHGKPIFKEIK